MRINLKNNRKQEGSILILTLLALVGALSIAVAMSSISIVERKMTTKSRKSVTAFQAANSGIEWAMKKINDASVSGGDVQKISDVFKDSSAMNGNGKISCGGDAMFGGDSNMDCEVYLLGGTNQNRTIITTPNTTLDKVVAIRSTGKYGKDEEQVGRSLEAYAMPNCADGEVRVADFCVEDELHSDDSWDNAIEYCAGAGKRLCGVSEVLAYWNVDHNNLTSGREWSADITGTNEAVTINDSPNVETSPTGANFKFRCCRNR